MGVYSGRLSSNKGAASAVDCIVHDREDFITSEGRGVLKVKPSPHLGLTRGLSRIFT